MSIQLNLDVTHDDARRVLDRTIHEQGFASHSIRSMNDFYTVGLPQIVTKIYQIDTTIDNVVKDTPADREIVKIRVCITFDNVQLKPPTTAGYHSGKEKMLMPNSAHVEDRTYRSSMFVDATVRVCAYLQGGGERWRTEKVSGFRIANIPTLVGSVLCNTEGRGDAELAQLHEDPRDPRAYFINSGKERSIDNTESVAFNQARVFRNNYMGESTRAEFISKPGDTYQNSKQVIVRLGTNGTLTVELIQIETRGLQLPFFLVFRALGWSTDREMLEHILYRGMKRPSAAAEVHTAGAPRAAADTESAPDAQEEMGYTIAEAARESTGSPGTHLSTEGATLEATGPAMRGATAAESSSASADASTDPAAGTDPAAVAMADLNARLFAIIDTAMGATYATTYAAFPGARAVRTQSDVLAYIARQMPREYWRELDLNNAEHLQQAVTRLLRMFDEVLLPHVGTTEAARHAKLRYVAHLINRMLHVELGLLASTDRDSYTTKRVHTPGISIGKAMKTVYNSSVIMKLRRDFINAFNNRKFDSVDLGYTFRLSVNGADLERALMQSITSSSATSSSRAGFRPVSRRLSSQIIDRKNLVKVYSTLRMIVSLNSETIKGSDRAKEMRMPHPSFQGFICMVQTDSGDKVGLHKQMALSTTVCSYGSSELIKQMIAEDTDITVLANVLAVNVRNKVFVNGDWIGCAGDLSALVQRYTERRRAGRLDRETTIEWDATMGEVHFWIDYGRPLRPLIIVYNTQRDWRALGLRAPASRFTQGIALTASHIAGLRAGRIGMRELHDAGVIEMITPQEQVRLLVATDVAHVALHRSDPLHQFTHCDIPEAMLSIAACTGPLAQYNQTTRNTFQTAQVRQACGYYAGNWPYRVDKDTFLQYQVERPLVYTYINSHIPHNGANVVVAIACYTGYNEEDSLAWNRASSDRLKFNGSWFTYDKIELEKNESFAIPDPARTTGVKSYANYRKLAANGIVPVGTVVRKGDVVVGKIKQLPRNVAEEKKVDYVDQSLVYKNEFPAIVHRVIEGKDDDATAFCKVGYRSVKAGIVGDKYSPTADHEVLTKRGWKCITTVTLGDEVATLVDGTRLEYAQPSEVMSFEHDGDMLEITNERVRCVVTMDHKLYMRTTRRAQQAAAPGVRADAHGYVLARCRDIVASGARKIHMQRAARDWLHATPETYTVPAYTADHRVYDAVCIPMREWITLFGIFVTQGCVDSAHLIRIAAHTPRVKKALESIESEHIQRMVNAAAPECARAVAHHLAQLGHSRERYLPEWCFELDQEHSRWLLHALLLGDGSQNRGGHREYLTRSARLAQHVQQLAVHCGWTCDTRTAPHELKSTAPHELKSTAPHELKSTARCDQYRVRITKSRSSCEPEVRDDEMRIVQHQGRVYCITVPSGVFMLRHKHPENIYAGHFSGNSARSGQKGVCALLMRQSDMPFTESGIIPDIIVNPHGLPKRMTTAMLLEGGLARLCAARGVRCEGTMFRSANIDDICKEMLACGYDEYGRERLYSGLTGCWMDSLIFMAPMYYQRLQKFVSKSVYSVDTGPDDIMTRQPVPGRANQGGMRISELQTAALYAHGCAAFTSDKMFADSDDFVTYNCRGCGRPAVVNKQRDIVECKQCGDNADVSATNSCWSSKQFFLELCSMGIGVRFHMAPATFHDETDDVGITA